MPARAATASSVLGFGSWGRVTAISGKSPPRLWSRTDFCSSAETSTKPKSSEQENSFNSQQCVTDFMHIATFRSKRIEQYAVIASHWLQHVRGVHQRGYEKSSLLRRDVLLVECFL